MSLLSARALLRTAALAACIVAPVAEAAIVYSLAGSGSRLIRFDTAMPSVVTSSVITGASGNSLHSLDVRPSNGMLYAYSDDNLSLYTLDPANGSATFVSTLSSGTNVDNLGIDFNPVPDRLRIVNPNDQNLRVNVDTGATTVDGTLAYAAGDPNAGADPNITEAAYTNSDTDPLTGTTLYYLDYILDTLVSTGAPNAGQLNTIGLLGVDIGTAIGFDIFTDGGTNTAYAALRDRGGNGLYTIDLGTGAATLLGAIGDASFLRGLAVLPSPALVPEPGTLALLGIAGLAAVAASRRRRASAA